MADYLPSIPGLMYRDTELFRRAVKEALEVAAGLSGENRDRFVQVGELIDAGVIVQDEEDAGYVGATQAQYGTPLPPTGVLLSSGDSDLFITTDGTTISRILVTWIAANDTNVLGYEIEAKKSLDADWIPIGQTFSRTETSFYIAPVQDLVLYDVRIRSFNASFQSAWVTVTSHQVLGKSQPPDDVTGFVAAQNGAVAVFRWNPVASVELAGYELRYGPRGNTTWDDATPLTRVTRGTNITSADIPPGDWTVFIKATDKVVNGNYSVNAAQDDLMFVNTYDVLTQVEQSVEWLGTLTNFVKHWTGVLLPDDQNTAASYGWEVFDEFVPTPFTTCTYESPEIDIGFDDTARIWAGIDSRLGPGEASGIAAPDLHIDYRIDAGAYDGFEIWSIGNRTARYFKFKLVLDTTKGKAVVEKFYPTIDNQEETYTVENVVVSIGGTVVNFPGIFHQTPIPDLIYLGSTPLQFVADALDTNSCVIRAFNSSGTDVGGTLNKLVLTGV